MTTSATFADLRVNNAEQFKESVSELTANTKLFLTFGKATAWANDLNPNIANTSVSTVYEVWNNMIGGKRLFGSDFSHVIPRHDWQSGIVYSAYDHRDPNLLDGNTIFYVVTSTSSVYKCLSNANGATSTIEPTSINPAYTTTTSDGYTWKYMYTISDADLLRFTTDSYIPVKFLELDDNSLQWQVQESAVDGSINAIFVTNPGNNYTNISNVSVVISGDGSSATAIPTIVANTITSIVITNPGQGYTHATASITTLDSGSDASLVVIISPPGGHGSNPLYELGGKNIMINGRLKYDEEGVLPTTNDYRQIAILKDPLLLGSNTEIGSALAFLQALTITCEGSGDYTQDELVFQGSDSENATFTGRVVSWDSSTSKLIVINISGSPSASRSLIGTTSFTTRVLTSVTYGYLENYSGRILYVDNVIPIIRASDQIEDFKILLRF